MNKFKIALSEKLTQKITRDKLSEFLAGYKTDSALVLDLGASKRPYKDLFPNAITLDIDRSKQIDVQADGQVLPFGDNIFDLIVCTCVLEHIPKPWIAINEMNRVLKRNGKAIIAVPFLFPIHDSPGDYFRFTRYGLQELFSNWKIDLLKEDSNAVESIAIILQRIGFQGITSPASLRFFSFIAAKAVTHLNRFWIGSFGDIDRSKKVNAFASNYYLIARKR